ncbi:MAG: hypothetical protein AB1813_03920 [Verrucomicrobiota bacterium]
MEIHTLPYWKQVCQSSATKKSIGMHSFNFQNRTLFGPPICNPHRSLPICSWPSFVAIFVEIFVEIFVATFLATFVESFGSTKLPTMVFDKGNDRGEAHSGGMRTRLWRFAGGESLRLLEPRCARSGWCGVFSFACQAASANLPGVDVHVETDFRRTFSVLHPGGGLCADAASSCASKLTQPLAAL